jgi:hypothetical protein
VPVLSAASKEVIEYLYRRGIPKRRIALLLGLNQATINPYALEESREEYQARVMALAKSELDEAEGDSSFNAYAEERSFWGSVALLPHEERALLVKTSTLAPPYGEGLFNIEAGVVVLKPLVGLHGLVVLIRGGNLRTFEQARVQAMSAQGYRVTTTRTGSKAVRVVRSWLEGRA